MALPVKTDKAHKVPWEKKMVETVASPGQKLQLKHKR